MLETVIFIVVLSITAFVSIRILLSMESERRDETRAWNAREARDIAMWRRVDAGEITADEAIRRGSAHDQT